MGAKDPGVGVTEVDVEITFPPEESEVGRSALLGSTVSANGVSVGASVSSTQGPVRPPKRMLHREDLSAGTTSAEITSPDCDEV
mmetsp:Transcript_39556/g.85319  ORF Transcript_39556/g.85319 Transcript_39556/m.85319 type:complete len:84 (+) Transcript_39556:395-646(+)